MKRRINKAYVLSALLLAMLVSGAFLLPKFTLRLQDYQATEGIRFSSRAGIDYEAINTEYETDVYQRMENFAEGNSVGKQYFITAGENKDELDDNLILDTYYKAIDSRYRMYGDAGSLAAGLPEVISQDYYVIYDQDANNGAALLCWYVQLEMEDACMSILMDAKDYTWYYMEFYDSGTDAMKSIYNKGNYMYGGLEYMLYDIAPYYGAATVIATDFSISKGVEVYDGEMMNEDIYVENGVFKTMADGSLSASLFYNDNALHYDVYYTEETKHGYTGIAMGIREIRELLPTEIKAQKIQD